MEKVNMAITKYSILLIFLSISLMAQSTISGRVVNGTHDSTAVSQAMILFQKMTPDAQMPEDVTETVTNRNGRFQVTVDSPELQATYFAATDFDGVRYFSDGINLPAEATDMTVVVYDSTHSTAGVDAFMHHIIIDDLGNALQFRETRVLNNPGDKTITSAFVEEHIGEALFSFHLPAGAMNFAPLSAQVGNELITHGHYVIDRGIFLPGNKTVSFAYEIPMQGKSVNLSLRTTHPTRTFDLFVSSDNIEISSPQLTDHGAFTIRGTEYDRYGVTEVPAGTNIPVTIRRVGASPTEQSPVLTITLTALLLILGLSYSFSRRKSSASQASDTNPQQLQEMKKDLVKRIAKMDIAANGDSKTSSERQALLQELQNIELRRARAEKKPRKKK